MLAPRRRSFAVRWSEQNGFSRSEKRQSDPRPPAAAFPFDYDGPAPVHSHRLGGWVS